jgi:1-deoxy-D-xylulose 5-phosphate reductoisomerase
VHSAVEFNDGAILAQMGEPDMRVPIQYAITYPLRAEGPVKKLSLTEAAKLEFFEPDFDWKKEVKEARKEKVKKMRGCLSEYARTDANEVKERLYMARSLHGIVPPDITVEEA